MLFVTKGSLNVKVINLVIFIYFKPHNQYTQMYTNIFEDMPLKK